MRQGKAANENIGGAETFKYLVFLFGNINKMMNWFLKL